MGTGVAASPTTLVTLGIANPMFVTMQGGMEQAETAPIAGIEGGHTYFNIHDSNFPGGELRTQLLPWGAKRWR